MFSKLFGSAAVAGALFAAGPASSANIVLVDQGGVAGSQAELGFKIAADYWGKVLTNDVTIRLGVGFSSLGEGVIGSTGSSGMDYTATRWEAGVSATRSGSTLDQSAVLPTLTNGAISMITSGPRTGNFGVNTAAGNRVYDTSTTGINSTNNKTLYLNTSVVKAIGGVATYDTDNTQKLDGDVTFSNTFGFDFDPTDGTSPQTFDFIGTAIHEFGHALGFVSGVDDYDYFASPAGRPAVAAFNMNQTSWFTALDMFRYSNDPTNIVPGTTPVLDFAVGSPSYFSIDGGRTQLFGSSTFSTGYYNGDGNQASHWKDNFTACTPQLGIMDPTDCYGQDDEVTALDLAAFDAMGWNLNFDVLQNPSYVKTTAAIYRDYMNATAAVPEAATWAQLVLGFGLLGGSVRMRRRRTALTAA